MNRINYERLKTGNHEGLQAEISHLPYGLVGINLVLKNRQVGN